MGRGEEKGELFAEEEFNYQLPKDQLFVSSKNRTWIRCMPQV